MFGDNQQDNPWAILWMVTRAYDFPATVCPRGVRAVAAGATHRLFTRATTAYFLAVLVSLGLVMWLMPGQGFRKAVITRYRAQGPPRQTLVDGMRVRAILQSPSHGAFEPWGPS